MANLTISVDEEVLKRARIRALERGTSVNAVLAEYLRAFAGEAHLQARATRSLVALAAENSKVGGRARAKARSGRGWNREDLHER